MNLIWTVHIIYIYTYYLHCLVLALEPINKEVEVVGVVDGLRG